MSLKTNNYFALISYLVIFISCLGNKKGEIFEEHDRGIYVYKFIEAHTYPTSISESEFWDEKEIELATIKFDQENDFDALKIEIQKMTKINQGLSENFAYAFLVKKENYTDTIYASLVQNLWTIKKKGAFIYYKDQKGEMTDFLEEYSSFFSSCW